MATFMTFGDVTFSRDAIVLIKKHNSQYIVYLAGVVEPITLDLSDDEASELDSFFIDKNNHWLSDPIIG